MELLYNTIIFPLYSLFELVFTIIYSFLGNNIILTIFFLSFLVNILCLPLYLNAEKLQKKEKDIQQKLKPQVDSIKKNFKGDERYMLLATLYRQHNYHPIMALRSSISLFLQIPLFTAAYLFFCHLNLLNGLSFGFINDFSKPDNLIHLGNFSINFLPVFMTFINLFAGYIYTKNCNIRENLQLYIISLVFLILLYNSPSGLVLYWTFNNFFSLIKNIFIKYNLFSKSAFPLFILTIVILYSLAVKYYVNLDFLVCIMFVYILNSRYKFFNFNFKPEGIFFVTCTAFFILYGILIPSNIVATQPNEFFFRLSGLTPLTILLYPSCQAFGLFILWSSVFFIFSNLSARKIISFGYLLFLIISVINIFYFKMPDVNLLPSLQYSSSGVSFYSLNAKSIMLYYCLILVIFFVIYILLKKKKESLISVFIGIISVSFAINSIFNIVNIKISMKTPNKNISRFEKIYNFNKNGKNVLIIFLDRAISSYLPIIFEERSELKNIYSGFTYYPNTVSYHHSTIFGYPPLIGGYEYTPLKMSKKNTSLVKLEKEARLVLPVLFKNNDWNVTVSDCPGEDIGVNGINTIFQKYNIKDYNVIGKYNVIEESKNNYISKFTKRNFIYFSFLLTSITPIKKYYITMGIT